MSAAQHTPGPWEVDGEYVQQVSDPSVGICSVLNMDEGGDKGWYSGPVTQANKRLIAAAPELLAALRALEAMAERYRPPGSPAPEDQKNARIAIARATGSQP